MPLVRSVGKKAFSLLLIPTCGCCCCCSTHGLPCQMTIENEHYHWTREVHLLAMNWMFEFQAWMNFENEPHWTREFISCRWFGCLSSGHEHWEWIGRGNSFQPHKGLSVSRLSCSESARILIMFSNSVEDSDAREWTLRVWCSSPLTAWEWIQFLTCFGIHLS